MEPLALDAFVPWCRDKDWLSIGFCSCHSIMEVIRLECDGSYYAHPVIDLLKNDEFKKWSLLFLPEPDWNLFTPADAILNDSLDATLHYITFTYRNVGVKMLVDAYFERYYLNIVILVHDTNHFLISDSRQEQ